MLRSSCNLVESLLLPISDHTVFHRAGWRVTGFLLSLWESLAPEEEMHIGLFITQGSWCEEKQVATVFKWLLSDNFSFPEGDLVHSKGHGKPTSLGCSRAKPSKSDSNTFCICIWKAGLPEEAKATSVMGWNLNLVECRLLYIGI